MKLEITSIVSVVGALFGVPAMTLGGRRFVSPIVPIFYPVVNTTRFRHHDDYLRRHVQSRSRGHQMRYHRRQYTTTSE